MSRHREACLVETCKELHVSVSGILITYGVVGRIFVVAHFSLSLVCFLCSHSPRYFEESDSSRVCRFYRYRRMFYSPFPVFCSLFSAF